MPFSRLCTCAFIRGIEAADVEVVTAALMAADFRQFGLCTGGFGFGSIAAVAAGINCGGCVKRNAQDERGYEEVSGLFDG